MIRLTGGFEKNLAATLQLEWLETNGLGGYASSTVVGLNTRRYHGLLTAAIRPPVERFVLLSKFEGTLIVDGHPIEFSSNQYKGTFYPDGYKHLVEFRLDPFPTFVYRIGDVEIERRIFMIQGENTTVIEHELRDDGGKRCSLTLQPLIAFRDYHSLTHQNNAVNPSARFESDLASIKPYGDLPTLYFAHNAAEVQVTGYWYSRFVYQREFERGLDFEEDLFNPFGMSFELSRNSIASVIVSMERRNIADVASLKNKEIANRKLTAANLAIQAPCADELTMAARQFIAARGQHKTIIAGYHWFTDWGRDTMVSLPGLTLVTGDYDVARSILLAFSEVIDRGMLPNRFPDAGETPEYNSVDATLWFFDAIYWFAQSTGDYAFVETRLFNKLTDIIDWHIRGTRYSIRANEHGLLTCGEPGVQLTWMDAKIGDWVVTPRYGMPVEVQALWYNALRILQYFTERFGRKQEAARFESLADKAKQNFVPLFWNQSVECLYDVVNGDVKDDSIRPNQIFTASLTFPLLADDYARRVIKVVERELLTPRGLRTLAPGHPAYRPRYQGDQRSRDSAYHQGTVWSWLLGPFVTAYARAYEYSSEALERTKQILNDFLPHLREAGLGQVSEIFDGDPPHRPRGCVAQAWGVAGILRANATMIQHQRGTASSSERVSAT